MKIFEKKGLTFPEILMVVVILSIMVGVVLPSVIEIRGRADINRCKNHLRQIQMAKDQWALENDMSDTDIPETGNIDSYIPGGVGNLYCPLETTKSFDLSYEINAVDTNPTCKIDGVYHDMDREHIES